MTPHRVAVTGVGLITPLGTNVQTNWQALISGETGISPLPPEYSTEHGYKAFVAGQIHYFDPQKNTLAAKELRRMERFVQMACMASHEALTDSGILSHLTDEDRESFGVSIGVGMGGVERMSSASQSLAIKGPGKVSPLLIPQIIPNMASGIVANIWGLKGPNICTTSACTSGTHGLGEAYLKIRYGAARYMLAGGAESAIAPIALASFGNMRALSQQSDPKLASRPFDQGRDGFVMGEGSGVMLLEEYHSAQKRGARVYGEIIGYGLSGDAHHITAPAPEGEGARRCMQAALKDARISAEQIDYLNAHGTSTPLNDLYESRAIHEAFGGHSREVLVSSTKGATGHLLGGAGGVEGCYTVLALHHQMIPPTINLRNPDPECDLNHVTGCHHSASIKIAMSNSFGFGGTNATLIFRIAS